MESSIRSGAAPQNSVEQELGRCRTALRQLLEQTLPERLADPEWYLTGVQVGLESLRRLYQASQMVYKDTRDRTVGARKLENLRHVYEQLESFERSSDATTRARIFLDEKDAFEQLLMDFEEGQQQSAGLFREHLTIIEQVAKDVLNAVNRVRTLEHLEKAVDDVPQATWFGKKGRERALEGLVVDYAPVLRAYGIQSADTLMASPKFKTVERRVKDDLKRSRRHVRAIRDEMYREKKGMVTDLEHPEVDLEPGKVIQFLKRTSTEGVAYLNRAYTAYQHSTEVVVGGAALLAKIRELKRALEAAVPVADLATDLLDFGGDSQSSPS